MRRIIVVAAVLLLLAFASAGSALSSDVTVYITRTGSCYHNTADAHRRGRARIPPVQGLQASSTGRAHRGCDRSSRDCRSACRARH